MRGPLKHLAQPASLCAHFLLTPPLQRGIPSQQVAFPTRKKRMNILSSAHLPHVSRASITPLRPTQLLLRFSSFCVFLSGRFGDHTVLLCVRPLNGCALLAPLSPLGFFGSVSLNPVTPVDGECVRLRWCDSPFFFSLLLVWSVWGSVCVNPFFGVVCGWPRWCGPVSFLSFWYECTMD